jgi:hypothetical protein
MGKRYQTLKRVGIFCVASKYPEKHVECYLDKGRVQLTLTRKSLAFNTPTKCTMEKWGYTHVYNCRWK